VVVSRQNIYDDPVFFDGYRRFRASGDAFNDLLEQPTIDDMLPAMSGLDVLDVGCGDGARSRDCASRGAATVLGIDPSERMLALAHPHPGVEYRRGFIEDLALDADSLDLVIASMSLHYVADLGSTLERTANWLRPGGVIVASMEHPIVSCRAEHEWCGARDHWPVDGYATEGPRRTRWVVADVVKYHRTTASIVDAVLAAGLTLTGLAEPANRKVEGSLRRPPILVIRATMPC
jgi:SAM-dependent methyltransferase